MSAKGPNAGTFSVPDSTDYANEDVDSDNPNLDFLSLSRAVKEREAEYTRRRTIRVRVGTWNVAAISGTEKDIGKWFVEGQGVCEKFSDAKGIDSQNAGASNKHSGEKKDKPFKCNPENIDLYVLGLQEVVDVSSPAEALRPYTDAGPSNRWKDAVQKALPPGYRLVSDVQLVGLLLLIFVSPAIGDSVSSVSSSSVGTGLMGYMGNKGAVATRLVLGETTRLVFVNSHLAAGADKGSLERRNWDASQITSRLKFSPAYLGDETRDDSLESLGDEDLTFWFGDLNYRLSDIPGDDVRLVLARHCENAHDTAFAQKESNNSRGSQPSSLDERRPSVTEEAGWPEAVTDEEIDPHNDPASLQTTISSLIVHDQLQLQQKQGKAFHSGWNEGHISFLPTYKYDVGSVAMFDSSEKNRGPSWCDRILYRTRRDKLKHEQRVREAEEARIKDKEMEDRGLDKAVADDDVLFDYDPDVDGIEVGSVGEFSSDESLSRLPSVASSEATDEIIRLNHYMSHQRILSSDHKPLDAIFTLVYDAVNPDLKAKVHQEVVRELDKAENEARPGLTVVVDQHHHHEQNTKQDPNAVHFGDVCFDVPNHRSLTIANTSGAPATFSFAERPSLGDAHKPETLSWLDVQVDRSNELEHTESVNISFGVSHTLLPGEVANVVVTAFVRSIEHVRLLNIRKAKLEEILVLHVDNGRDHFISVSGNWLPTCFGCSVDELTRMPEAGARSLASSSVPNPLQKTDEVRLSAPRELFRLTEAISGLTERAIAEWSMTTSDSGVEAPWTIHPGWPFQPDAWTLQDPYERAHLSALVRESLDTNESLSKIFPPEISSLPRLEILSETLLTFLNSLSDGIITASVWQDMEQQMIASEKAKVPPRSWEEMQGWVLESLAYSPAHSVSFTFVTFMLARITNEVTPIPSTQPISPLSKSKHKKTKSNESMKSQDQPPAEEVVSMPTPTSESSAAFTSAGSFRRKSRSATVSSILSSSSEWPAPAVTPKNPLAVRRQAVEASLATIFARVLISPAVPTSPKEKERRAADERKRSVIEPFLKMIGVDERGPSGGR
ncbi:hypothetical protein N7495_000964 [Penicillium taxi]|uniref:uncharacterized protein n=1 Tax=Penicillium taxi TaxID=168475 RepID=UPI00254518CD|nr:uncharacterized protein N7495_000964 [Penicillium taxi]KAJ5908282.1 hypothetical protein N7495_000964 [Penicillium taxi]